MSNGKLAVVGGKWIIPAEHAGRKIGGSTNEECNKADYAHLVAFVQGKYQDNEANARRLVACWNAFEGVGTDKIEGKSVAEYVCGEAYFQGMQPIEGGLSLGLTGNACQMFASAFAGQFKGIGALNFIEVQMSHAETGPFIVTMQRQNGETPSQQKAAALRDLAAARVLLADAEDAFDEFPDQDHEVADRIRAFLKG